MIFHSFTLGAHISNFSSHQFLKSLAIYLRLRTVIISGVETFEELIDPLDKPNALFHNKWVHIHFRASISRLPLACRCYARHEESMKMYHDNYRRAPLSVPRPIYRPFANIELTRYWILIRSQLLRSLSLNPACQIPIKSPPFLHLHLPPSLALIARRLPAESAWLSRRQFPADDSMRRGDYHWIIISIDAKWLLPHGNNLLRIEREQDAGLLKRDVVNLEGRIFSRARDVCTTNRNAR